MLIPAMVAAAALFDDQISDILPALERGMHLFELPQPAIQLLLESSVRQGNADGALFKWVGNVCPNA